MRLACFLPRFLALTALAVAAPSGARAQSAADSDALSAYDEQAVGVRHLVVPLRDGTTTDQQGRVLYSGEWDAFQGPDHHPIDEEAFFRIVGRDDLARRHHREAIVKRSLSVGGWVLVLGGAIATGVAVMPRAQPAVGYQGGGPAPYGLNPAWSLGAMGAGLVSIIVSHFLDPTPVNADEADRLARDHDRSLQSRFGLTDTAARD
ncbi:MAG TPA: hypothetical protein VKZ18_05510 [Polyangia bacterium]|nr:hypothetical protein [Polyangia bacterium]